MKVPKDGSKARDEFRAVIYCACMVIVSIGRLIRQPDNRDAEQMRDWIDETLRALESLDKA